MTRFVVTTLIAIAIASVLALMLPDPARSWAVAALWVIYLSICTLGTARVGLQFYCRSICRAEPGHMQIALTFDDGPDPNSTPHLLDFLRRENIPAAFFCIGKNVDAHPGLTARIASEGHLLANHTYTHPWWIGFLWSKQLTDEMTRTQQAIQRAANVTPKFARSPMGITNPHLPRALRNTDLKMIGWDIRTFDTTGDVHGATDRILRRARDGSIILLHDGGVEPQCLLEILRTVIPELRSRGFGFQRLDRLLDQPAGKSADPIGSSPAR